MIGVLHTAGQGNGSSPLEVHSDGNSMIELTDFIPLKVAAETGRPTRARFDRFDHILFVVGRSARGAALARLPYAKALAPLLRRARQHGEDHVSSRVSNARGTGVTAAVFKRGTAFANLSWAAKIMRECGRDKPASLAVIVVDLDTADERFAAESLVAAAHAASFSLPSFKTGKDAKPPARLKTLRLMLTHAPLDLASLAAEALGNNLARWFTALPPNVLTASSYRAAIEQLAKPRGLHCRFLDESELQKLGAGAFLAVARGNATRDAGIMHVRYRPPGGDKPSLALVGKGVLFDTGGTNLKPFKGMLDMHTDMQGSAVALGVLLALAQLGVPYGVDAWLAITENRMARDAYKSQDVVAAANGTTIQVIHTDAEGRMVLADTLALAAREAPAAIIDYATLTGTCVMALTERYAGVFTNTPGGNSLLQLAGAMSGERVWPFPMDEDYDELLKSDIADIKQCSAENEGDHILGARFLRRFVPNDLPWVHLDLSAAQHKGGLAHIPTEITGFGVRFTLELLRRCTSGPVDLAARMSA
jgi:leucyl aminopeptidase